MFSTLNDADRNLEEGGIQTHVKDMSLEKGFPTIGLLCDFEVFNTNKSSFFNRERFHLQVGSATSMDVALERCFTELFQNDNENDARMKESKRQIMQIDKVYESWPLLDELIPKRALFVTLYLRNGFFPSKYINFILDDRGTHSYWNYDDKDYLNEINSLFSLLNENKFHCYVKDYSWLGFPTLSIIVPELHFGYNEIDYEGIRLASFKKKILFDFNNLKKNDLQILNDPEIILRIISRIYNVGRFFQIEVPC
ncbi:MAG: YcaO-like family protein [Promethearchaeota archaeon]